MYILVVGNYMFCGDAAMNGFPSIKRLTIWIENVEQFKQSGNVLVNEVAEMIYPAHGKPFDKNDIRKYIGKVPKVRLHSLEQLYHNFRKRGGACQKDLHIPI